MRAHRLATVSESTRPSATMTPYVGMMMLPKLEEMRMHVRVVGETESRPTGPCNEAPVNPSLDGGI